MMRRPMLALPGRKEDLGRTDMLFEPKLDGTRALCYKDGRLRFINRRDHEITSRYPEFDFLADLKAASCVLDGEVVVFDKLGNPSFRLLQKREHSGPRSYQALAKRHPAVYVAFDILEREGKDLTSLPLVERRKELERVVTEGPALRLIVAGGEGGKMWELAKARGIEGLMAKRLGSSYQEGRRSPDWRKIKSTMTMDCVIVGFTSEVRSLSSLALALYSGKDLYYVGRVGTGFGESFVSDMRSTLDGMRVEEPPVANPPDVDVHWVRPELVCEVEYLEVTGNLHLRAPSFLRMREDKDPSDCMLEQIAG